MPRSAAALTLLAIAGCGSGRSADDRINAEFSRTGQSRDTVFPLSGKNRRLVVVLYGPPESQQSTAVVAFAECKSDGCFAFETLRDGDGVRPGDYFNTFADLIGPAAQCGGRRQRLLERGTDGDDLRTDFGLR